MAFVRQLRSLKICSGKGARAALTALGLALVTIAGSQGCADRTGVNSGANANTNPNVSVTVSSAPTNGASAPIPPAGLPPVPASLLNTEIKTLDGKPLRLADYAGKVVVLDIWATWCGPCRNEIPELVQLKNQYAERGLEVIGLTVEDPASADAQVREFARELKINYKLGWAERYSVALPMMNITGRGDIPQTFVITRDGHILGSFVGFNPQRSPLMLRQKIEQALKEGNQA